MSKVRSIIKLYTEGVSKKSIGERTGLPRNSVKKYIRLFLASGRSAGDLEQMSDTELEQLFLDMVPRYSRILPQGRESAEEQGKHQGKALAAIHAAASGWLPPDSVQAILPQLAQSAQSGHAHRAQSRGKDVRGLGW